MVYRCRRFGGAYAICKADAPIRVLRSPHLHTKVWVKPSDGFLDIHFVLTPQMSELLDIPIEKGMCATCATYRLASQCHRRGRHDDRVCRIVAMREWDSEPA